MKAGEKIKLYRTNMGLSQEELARKVGLKKAAINKYETGRVENIKRTTLMKLSTALQVTPSDLLDDEIMANGTQTYSKATDSELIKAFMSSELIQELVKEAKNVSADDLKILIEMTKRFQK